MRADLSFARLEVNVKSKKLIILISVVLVVAVVIAVLASVFAVRKVFLDYHNFDGSLTQLYGDEPTANEVLKFCKGKSIFFLSKDKLQTELNKNFPDWHVVGIVKNFPNSVDIHFVKRRLAAKLDIGGNTVYVDSFGYVMNTPEDTKCVDISSAFDHREASLNSAGEHLQFVESVNNERFDVVIAAIMSVWTFDVDLGEDMTVVLGEQNVFTFDSAALVINMPSGAKIKIMEPTTTLRSVDPADESKTLFSKYLHDAFSVYYNESMNLQRPGVVITVKANGDVITPSN